MGIAWAKPPPNIHNPQDCLEQLRDCVLEFRRIVSSSSSLSKKKENSYKHTFQSLKAATLYSIEVDQSVKKKEYRDAVNKWTLEFENLCLLVSASRRLREDSSGPKELLLPTIYESDES